MSSGMFAGVVARANPHLHGVSSMYLLLVFRFARVAPLSTLLCLCSLPSASLKNSFLPALYLRMSTFLSSSCCCLKIEQFPRGQKGKKDMCWGL